MHSICRTGKKYNTVIEEINRNVDHVKESSTELCTASDEIARSAVNLSEIAADMKEQVGRFRT